ncbi:traS protein [Kingella kingae]|uniref:relaxase/mobilization nuclease domain-containing protein n=1 Tax=Kingella kingae TaxID=504 RepID=UPI00050A031B|nr:traS protein [Kingella kingae]MDK4525608.1 traS protein [Kingella kingae]MDK4532684.1 traS protein [Kingella kingae]CRZ20122.1 TraS relaxase [Kingella kingae]
MSIHRQIDDWFLGYATRAVRSKENPLPRMRGGRGKGLKTGFGLRNLVAAAKKHPEVMVKIPKRLSQNSKGLRGIRNHLDYVSRNGEVELETHTGEKLYGKKDVKRLLHQWQKSGIPEESRHREAINIVLSMPAGTPPEAVKNAAREFAAEQFPNNQYAFALHHEAEREGEPPHPHVHLCVLMQNDMGERLNPRKNDLFEWRVRFAEKLRDEGVQCAATKRPQRGKTQKAENSIVRAVKQRGVQPERFKQWQIELAAAIKEQRAPVHPYLDKAVKTRDELAQEYAQIAQALYRQGYKTEARLIGQLKRQLDTQDFTTRMQQSYRTENAKIRFGQMSQPEKQPAPEIPKKQPAPERQPAKHRSAETDQDYESER